MSDNEARTHLNLYADGYVAGLAKAKAAENEFRRNSGQNFKKVGDDASKALNPEKMTKYGTSVAALTGQMGNLGIGGDAVSKSIAVASDALSGMMSGVGVAVIGIGALAAAIGYTAQKQQELEKATKGATDAILAYVIAKGHMNDIDALTVKRSQSDLEAQKRGIEMQLEVLGDPSKLPEKGSGIKGAAIAGLVTGLTQGQFIPKLTMGFDEAKRLNAELHAVNAELAKIQEAQFMGPPRSAMSFEDEKKKQAEKPGTFNLQYELEEQTRNGIITKKKQTADVLKGESPVTPEEIAAYDALAASAEKNFSAIQAAGTAAYRVISAEASKAHNLQSLMHLKLGKMYIQSMREGLASYIDTKAQEAMTDAGMEAYKAIASLASGDFAGAALHAKAAAMAGLKGGSLAISASMVRGGGGGAQEGPVGNMGSDTRDYGGRASATTISSGGGAQSFVYNFNVIHQGATVYGDGGIRQMFNQDLWPLIREAMAFRAA